MISSNFNYKVIYREEGEEYAFNHSEFKKYYDSLKETNCKKRNIREELSDKTGASISTVKNWIKGTYLPSQITEVKNIAEYFRLDDFKELLISIKEEENKMNKINEYDTGIATEGIKIEYKKKTVYKKIVDYIEMFRRSKGFSVYAIHEEGFINQMYEWEITQPEENVGADEYSDFIHTFNDVMKEIRYARLYLDETVVEQLVSLVSDISDMEEHRMHGPDIEYDDYGRKIKVDYSDEYYHYLSVSTVEYYSRLDKILSDYLA